MSSTTRTVAAVWAASAVALGPLVPIAQAADTSPPATPTTFSPTEDGTLLDRHNAVDVDQRRLFANVFGVEHVEGTHGLALVDGQLLATELRDDVEGPVGSVPFITAASFSIPVPEVDPESGVVLMGGAITAGTIRGNEDVHVVAIELVAWHPAFGPDTPATVAPLFTTPTIDDAVAVARWGSTFDVLGADELNLGPMEIWWPDYKPKPLPDPEFVPRHCVTERNRCREDCSDDVRNLTLEAGGLYVACLARCPLLFGVVPWVILACLAVCAALIAAAGIGIMRYGDRCRADCDSRYRACYYRGEEGGP